VNLFDQIFNDVITPYLEPRLKKTSIQAVKAYIKSIEAARKVAVTSYGTGIAAASAVAGVVLMLVAIIGLLPSLRIER
jgi:outer membrane protein TolC